MKRFTIYFLSTLYLGLLGCRKESTVQPKEYPYVITKSVTNIDSSGATLEAYIWDFGKEVITDYGFRLNDSYQYSLKNQGSFANFKIRISTDLVNGITYRCRAYVRTTKNLVLGNELSFVGLGSKSPIIEDFNPKEGCDGTVVTLQGKYFSQSGSTLVFVNKLLADVIYSSEDSIVFKTPSTDFIGEATISIETGSQKIIFNSKFKILGPEIESVSSLSGHSGESILIKGKNLIQNGSNLAVFFGSFQAKIMSNSDTLVKVIVPIPEVGYGIDLITDQPVLVKLTNGLKTTYLKDNFFVILKSWESRQRAPFDSFWKNQAVTYNGKGYILEEFSENKLYEYSPNSDKWNTVSSNLFPGDRIESSLYIVSGDNLFKIGGHNYLSEPINELWVFSFTEKIWLKKNNIPFNLFNGISYTLNNQMYILSSEGQLWKCNLENELYTRINDFPGTFKNSFASSFIANDKAYVVLNTHTWQYNESADSWIEKSINPYTKINNREDAIGFSLNGTGYVLHSGLDLYKYDITNDMWVKISKYPGCWGDFLFKTIFTIGDKAYVVATAGENYCFYPEMYSFQE